MRIAATVTALILAFAAAPLASAHAFPDNSSPHVGATVNASPPQVRIWFNGEIEPVFSTLLVKDTDGRIVSRGKGSVAASDHKLLETSLPTLLAPGKYSVYWSVVAHDGHHTQGHFAFTVK